MEPYFSVNYAQGGSASYPMYEQHLFIDARDYFTPGTISTSTPVSFTVTFASNSFSNNGNTTYSSSLNVAPYEHVKTVQLLGVCFPKVKDEMYCVIDIPEFNGRLHHSDKHNHDSFATLYFDTSKLNTGDAKPLKGYDFDKKVYVYNPPESRLNRFTINFKKYGGAPVTFGDLTENVIDSTEATSVLAKISLLMSFEIKR